MNLPLKWEFPGGKMEINETAEECIKREIREELNLDIELIERIESQVHKYESFTINLIPFISKYLSGEIILTEHECVRWITKDELEHLDWAPADISVKDLFLKLHNDATRSL